MSYIEPNETEKIKKEIARYISFWPFFIISILSFLTIAFLFLRYSTKIYESSAKIEIIDKAQDSEMSLPTAMTVFNRSLINLDNEIGVLNSKTIHERAVKTLGSNVRFYNVGRVNTIEVHKDDWFDDYELDLKIVTDTVNKSLHYEIEVDSQNKLKISQEIDGFYKDFTFDNLSTYDYDHDLPFDLKINSYSGDDTKKKFEIDSYNYTVLNLMERVSINKTSNESDQLNVIMRWTNPKICDDYINSLLSEFDKDGIVDRQLEYKRTMEFVDSRSSFLNKELEQVEIRKKNFLESNNLTDIKSDAQNNINQQFIYDAELFESRSQRDLAVILQSTVSESDFDFLPINIGLESNSVNNLINDFNLLIKDRQQYLVSTGPNHPYIKVLNDQINKMVITIKKSIKNYQESLEKKIKNLEEKEKEFASVYNKIPQNQKVLRSIERELEIKESLFLLLLQKREEAAINYAVVKPSIKIIDSANSSSNSVYPSTTLVYLFSLSIGFLFPVVFLFFKFYFDKKIHTRIQLKELMPEIPVVSEIPFIDDLSSLTTIIDNKSRNLIAESVRMIIANLNFIFFKDDKISKKDNVVLITSSIKGEGKTIVSINTAKALSFKFNKVLLIGADLRNPQLHKFLGISKGSKKGVSDYIYSKNLDWKKLIVKQENLDILLSGTIPPNPTQMLSSNKFNKLINECRNEYDMIVIDSAPCLIVSDTFEISKYASTTLYIVRSNFSEIDLIDFIKECHFEKKLNNINFVLNGVGNSQAYGYKYGYQYGYKYGYNYGYGYGYDADR